MRAAIGPGFARLGRSMPICWPVTRSRIASRAANRTPLVVRRRNRSGREVDPERSRHRHLEVADFASRRGKAVGPRVEPPGAVGRLDRQLAARREFQARRRPFRESSARAAGWPSTLNAKLSNWPCSDGKLRWATTVRVTVSGLRAGTWPARRRRRCRTRAAPFALVQVQRPSTREGQSGSGRPRRLGGSLIA